MNVFKRIWLALCEPFVEEVLVPEKTVDEYIEDLAEILGCDPPTLRRRVAEIPHHVFVHLKEKHDHQHQ